MAIFHHFLTFLATFLVVTTTFMDKTCTERTQTLVTCMVGGTDPFCPSPGAYYGTGGGPKYGYFGGENRAVMAGLLWGEDPTWKPIYAPYHILLHGLIYIRVIFDLS